MFLMGNDKRTFTIQYIFRKFILISEGTTTSNESVPPNLIQLVTDNKFF